MSTDHSSKLLRSIQILIVLVATVLHGVFLSKAKPLQSANDRSRWCTVWSLVERGTFQIDEIRRRPGWDTIDLVHVDEHFYSTKPPLLTTMVAGIVWTIQRATGWNLVDQLQPITFWVLVLINLIPFTLSLIAWIAILQRIGQQPWTRLLVLTAAAFGTLLTPFLMTLNNHTVAAAAVTFALYALVRIRGEEQSTVPASVYALCGISAAWAAVNELPALLFLMLAFWLSLQTSVQKTAKYFVPAAVIPLIALLMTNIIATGSWKPIYAAYGTEKYNFVIDGIPSYWMNPQGIDRNLDSFWIYLWNCLLGHHGVFSLTPVAILGAIGWLAVCFRGVSFNQRRERPAGASIGHPAARQPAKLNASLQQLVLIGAITFVVVLAFYLSRTQNYNYGGVSCGLRWALWLTPFWLIAMVPVLDALAQFRSVSTIVVILLSVSMYSAWWPIENPWRHPWLFQWMEARGWINYSEPPLELERPLWTWFEKLPKVVENESSWVEFTAVQPNLPPKIIRLTGTLPKEQVPGQMMNIEVRESGGFRGSLAYVRKFAIDMSRFNKGASPAEFLRWTDPSVTPAQQQADLAFVRGLPLKVPYQARVKKYLRTPLRNEALRCIQAAAQVKHLEADGATTLIHRCDTWLSADVPFGVAQVEFRISDNSGTTLFQERWMLHDCSPNVLPFGK